MSLERLTSGPARLRERANLGLRRAIGIDREPPQICLDPERAYVPVDAEARLIHADLPAMLVGGLGSLFFQMLHPHSRAGVAQHSRYREDPLGRIRQTANYIATTTFGTRDEAAAAIAHVRQIHEYVRGVADDGVAYSASDPHLLDWVHVAGTRMFLSAYQRYGPRPLSPRQADAYVAQVAPAARELGAKAPPHDVRELDAAIEQFRPELRLSPDAREARDFLLRGTVQGVHQRAPYRLLVDAALSLLPSWAAESLQVAERAGRAPLQRPLVLAFNAAVRRVVPARGATPS